MTRHLECLLSFELGDFPLQNRNMLSQLAVRCLAMPDYSGLAGAPRLASSRTSSLARAGADPVPVFRGTSNSVCRNWFASARHHTWFFCHSRHVPLEYLEVNRFETMPSS